MQYFTPVRYLRLGNLEDRQAFLAAQEEWELAVEQYQGHLDKIRGRLPVSLRRLIGSVYLHDATVLDMWRARKNQLTITLRPESDPARLVVLTYALDKPAQVRRNVLPTDLCTESVAWLYDELDVRPVHNGRPRYLHRILLSNGWEFALQFHAVKVARPEAIIPLTQSA